MEWIEYKKSIEGSQEQSTTDEEDKADKEGKSDEEDKSDEEKKAEEEEDKAVQFAEERKISPLKIVIRQKKVPQARMELEILEKKLKKCIWRESILNKLLEAFSNHKSVKSIEFSFFFLFKFHFFSQFFTF